MPEHLRALVSVRPPVVSMPPSGMVTLLVVLLVLVTAGSGKQLVAVGDRKEPVTVGDGKEPVTAGGGEKLGCRNHKGELVDWYVLYKLPKMDGTGASFVDSGTGYAYYSSISTSELWSMSDVSISDPLSFPGRTLQPLYDYRATLAYAFYNDVPPGSTTDSVSGHTKGVVAFDDDGGFWMVHSVPGFPPAPGSNYSFPDSGKQLGQSFLCVTLPFSKMETVAKQLLYNKPSIYAIELSFQVSNYSMMTEVMDGNRSSVEDWYSIQHLNESGGMEIISFAKTGEFGFDLYYDLASTHLKTSLYTETWLGPASNPARLPSICDTAYIETLNILKIQIWPEHEGTMEFNNTEDNSKWAVGGHWDQPHWVCIGDIDRVLSQKIRGGGMICLKNSTLWKIYSELHQDAENVERCRP